ncbi:MAG TPA: hypothetical protein VIE65_02735 [Methylobacter sp.]|jgi:DNA replicative helicase MCM subunit Mcm2 (Cdc46/Mcm family)
MGAERDMELSEAWNVLGEDPENIFQELTSKPDVQSRIASAKDFLKMAERVARILMKAHHPDLNQSDPRAQLRFRRVQKAIQTIRVKTTDLEKKALEPKTSQSDGKLKVILR